MATCSWCYRSGHNRRTCPSRTDSSKKMDPKPRCSYCSWKGIYESSFGHNRRSCTILRADLEEAYHINSIYRKGAIEILSENGVGPGSLVSRQKYSWLGDAYGYHQYYFILRSLCWDRFSIHVCRLPIFTASPVDNPHQIVELEFHMPVVNGETWLWDKNTSQWVKCVSRMYEAHINHDASLLAGSFNPSDAWLSGRNPMISQKWRNSRKP